MYQLVNNILTGQLCAIKRTSDSAFIPLDEQNADYQAYLAWVAAGNTAEPAEEN